VTVVILQRMDDQRIGAAVRRLRIGQQLRQIDLAAKAGVPRTAVISIEAGRLEDVSLGYLRRIATALGGRFEGQVL
jgi:transcriptional regulator with XRE-family HTH domain